MERLVDGCVGLVDVATPTGDERATAERAVALLAARGVDANLDPIDERAANAWAIIPSIGPRAGTAPTVMLYSPLDTVTTGDDRDLPHVADEIDGHLRAAASVERRGDGEIVVRGLGAQNPKGHAASVLEAAAMLAACGDLAGDVVVGFGAGGMPTEPIDPDTDPRPMTGHGVGVAHLLDTLRVARHTPDAAVVAKSGWFAQHEEVGFAWIDVVVRGTHTYVGSRHRLPYRNAVADAARVVLALEDEFADVTGRAAGTLEPQAMVASLHGGWQRMGAFLPASARVRCDIRLLPTESAEHARERVESVVRPLRDADAGLDVTIHVAGHIAGSHTSPDHPICAAARRSWESIEGRSHGAPTRLSGSTDANTIRQAGVPTVRIGLPKVHVDGVELGFAEGMNTVTASSMARLTDLLVRTVHEFHGTAQGEANR